MAETNYDITTFQPNQQRFIHLYLTGQYTHVKLAQLLDVHINTITLWLKREDVRAIIAQMQDEQHEAVGMQINAMTNKAINAMNELLDSPIDGVRLQAVKDVLDRGGFKPKQEIKIDKTVTTYEEKLSNLIAETAIDVDCEEV